MSKRTLLSLSLFAVVLILLFVWGLGPKTGSSNISMFSGIDWGAISKIRIEKEGNFLELSTSADNAWVVSSRNSYPASGAAVTGLLFKLMDLTSVQPMELNAAGLSRLGLTEETKSSGQGVLSIFGKEGTEIEKLYLGGLRNKKNATSDETIGLSGQFVKQASKTGAFLLPLPIALDTAPASWLDTLIVSVPESAVYQVSSLDGNLLAKRKSIVLTSSKPEFEISAPPIKGKEVDPVVLGQVTAGLDDVKLEDVFPLTDASVSALDFSKGSNFELISGLVYKVSIAEKDGKKFLKLAVSLDEALAERIIAKESEELKATPEDKKQVKVTKSSVEEAAKINGRFSKWVYQVPEYVANRLVKSVDMLYKDITTAPEVTDKTQS